MVVTILLTMGATRMRATSIAVSGSAIASRGVANLAVMFFSVCVYRIGGLQRKRDVARDQSVTRKSPRLCSRLRLVQNPDRSSASMNLIQPFVHPIQRRDSFVVLLTLAMRSSVLLRELHR